MHGLTTLSVFALLLAPGAPVQKHSLTTREQASRSARLPLTHVSLYKDGVGFFEHAGRVEGDQSVVLDLTTAQLNDVLQSLTAVDLGGGHITGAEYNSTTPLAQQLRALPLSLGPEPSEEGLYTTLRGARVEVTGSGAPFNGRILSYEVRTSAEKDSGAPEASRPGERRYLTVLSDSGAARTLEMASGTVVRVMDTPLRTDLNTYLALLDSNRSQGMRHLTLSDSGAGSRELRVSFLSEVPIWKSTYRILLTDAPLAGTPSESATLQGYSVVDNTTGEDWRDVQLSLIAGSPQSFLQPLAQPIYSRRPSVPIAEDVQLTPQTHDSGMDGQQQASAGMEGMGGGGGGILGGVGSGGGVSAPGVAGFGPAASSQASGGPTFMRQMVVKAGPAKKMVPYETLAAASTAPAATTAAFDDYFAYNLSKPVTIPRNGSALVPILQTKIASERVTLWSPTAATALRALWITNGSALTIDSGSFSIVENGAFGGEGILETIHPGERRLLSYAADQAVHVSTDSSHDTHRVSSLAVSHGVLRAATVEIAEVEYLVHNAAPEPRLVIVEQPRREGWTLDSDPAPAETTASAYRFRVATAPRETVRLHIGERHTIEQHFRLADTTDAQLSVFLRDANASPAVLGKLEPVLEAKQTVAALDTQIAQKQEAVEQLANDQKRVRDDLGALKGSAEERSLARRYTAELNTQEDTLASLRRELDEFEGKRQTAAGDLDREIEAFTMEETL